MINTLAVVWKTLIGRANWTEIKKEITSPEDYAEKVISIIR
jgi:hypothetical protein